MHRRRNDDDLIPVEKRKRVIMVDNDRGRRRGLRGLKLVFYSFSALLLLLIISAIAGFVAFQSSLSKVKKAANKAVPEIREVGNGIFISGILSSKISTGKPIWRREPSV